MKGPGSLPASIALDKPLWLYMLDRNVLAFIKDYQNATRSQPVSKFLAARSDNHQRLQALRSLDRDNAQFSPLLSIMEGQIAKPQAAKDIRLVARKELKAVGDFFQVGAHDAHLQHNPAFYSRFGENLLNDEIRALLHTLSPLSGRLLSVLLPAHCQK